MCSFLKHEVLLSSGLRTNVLLKITYVLNQPGSQKNGLASINSCMGSLWMQQDGDRVREMLTF